MTGKELLPLIRSAGRGDRMSENLYRWVKKHQIWEIGAAFSQLNLLDGSEVAYNPAETQPHQIIITTGTPDHFTSGSRLSTILGDGAKAEKYAFTTHSFNIVPLHDWWQGYVSGGKCFIDPEHRLYMDDERWLTAVTGQVRDCLWCGHHRQQKRVEMVEREYWDSVTALVMRGEGR